MQSYTISSSARLCGRVPRSRILCTTYETALLTIMKFLGAHRLEHTKNELELVESTGPLLSSGIRTP